MTERTREQFDQGLATEAARFAGLRGSQGPGLAQLFELVRADERKRVLDELDAEAPWPTHGSLDVGVFVIQLRELILKLRGRS